jgi:hypothetical protein
MRTAVAAVVLSTTLITPAAAWRAEFVATPGPVRAIDAAGGEVRVGIGAAWFRVEIADKGVKLVEATAPVHPALPPGALRDSRVATGRLDIARAWLADPTSRYRHGVLGDAIEAGSLIVERRDGGRDTVKLPHEAVFEDLEPRIADLDGDGREEVIVVKSYLARGSALAVVGLRAGRCAILAETPPIGHANAWLNPAGIGDFDGDGHTDIALVRQPHVVGRLELWSWRQGSLQKAAEIADVSNHFIGSRALHMSATADFDGDGKPDLAVPSLDRKSLRLVAFAPRPREIARIALPARVTTGIGLVIPGDAPAVLLGLEDGKLMLLRR